MNGTTSCHTASLRQHVNPEAPKQGNPEESACCCKGVSMSCHMVHSSSKAAKGQALSTQTGCMALNASLKLHVSDLLNLRSTLQLNTRSNTSIHASIHPSIHACIQPAKGLVQSTLETERDARWLLQVVEAMVPHLPAHCTCSDVLHTQTPRRQHRHVRHNL